MNWVPDMAGIREGLLRTKVGDKLLGNIHPAQQLLQEAKGEPFLNGRRIQLHVLKASAWKGGGRGQPRPRTPFPTFLQLRTCSPRPRIYRLLPRPGSPKVSGSFLDWTHLSSPGLTPRASASLWPRPHAPVPALLASSLLWPLLHHPDPGSPSFCPAGAAPAPHRSQAQGSAHVPGDRITVHLQELQQLLGLLSISCFLLGRERVIGDQQGVGPTT